MEEVKLERAVPPELRTRLDLISGDYKLLEPKDGPRKRSSIVLKNLTDDQLDEMIIESESDRLMFERRRRKAKHAEEAMRVHLRERERVAAERKAGTQMLADEWNKVFAAAGLPLEARVRQMLMDSDGPLFEVDVHLAPSSLGPPEERRVEREERWGKVVDALRKTIA